jgi:hypothetical protein
MEAAAAAAYNESMEPLRNAAYVCAEDSSKAIAFFFETEEENDPGVYTDRFIPEELKAQTYEEVRFLVQVKTRSSYYGEYFGGGKGYSRNYDVQIFDLLNGNLLGENTFTQKPPSSVEFGSGDHYGGYPHDNVVMEWVPGAITEGLTYWDDVAQKQAYHYSMSVLDEDDFYCDSSADKAVVKLSEIQDDEYITTFTTTYLSDDWIADTPEEVRFLVEMKVIRKKVGIYFVTTPALQQGLKIKISDLTTNSIIAENTHWGPEPPSVISDISDATGDLPDPVNVSTWITKILDTDN